MIRAAATVVLLVLLGVGCATTSPSTAARATSAVVKVRANVPDAMVWIDDHVVGEVALVKGGIRLPAGAHRLEVRHDLYHTSYLELTLAKGEVRTVDVTLSERLP